MKRYPDQSTLKCIGNQCDQKPVGLLVGRHPRGYEVQIMMCRDDLEAARTFARTNLPGIQFNIWENPGWLPRVQAEEIKNQDQIASPPTPRQG